MRVTRFSLAGVLLYACFVAAQNSPGIPSPSVADAGALDGSTYTNRLLDFSFALPTGWEPRQDLAHELRDGSFVLLVADRENETPYRDRLLIISDIAARYPSLSLSGYVHKLAESWHTQGSEILHQGLDEDVGSQHFYRVDYADPSGPAVLYKTFIATQRRGFFLSWTFVVQRKEQLTELVQSLHHSVVFRGENTPITGVISSHPVQPPDPSKPLKVRVSESVSQALIKTAVQPTYPPEARKQHVEGTVLMTADISEAGDVENVRLISGDPLLAPAALTAVKEWKYTPYLLNGRAAKVETQVTVIFTLQPD